MQRWLGLRRTGFVETFAEVTDSSAWQRHFCPLPAASSLLAYFGKYFHHKDMLVCLAYLLMNGRHENAL